MFNVIILGGEDTNNYAMFQEKCIFYLRNKANEGITIYSTGDSFVDRFAKRYGINVKIFLTDWKNYGKNALKKRNSEMVSTANAIIAFNPTSNDDKYLIGIAKYNNIPYRMVTIS